MINADREMKKAVQFGAGSIGRGFLGQLFFESGYETVFIDVDEVLVSELNRCRSYPLRIVGDNPREVLIEKVRAVRGNDIRAVAEEIRDAHIMATAVGVGAIRSVAPLIARGMEERAKLKVAEPLNLIIAENLLDSASVVKRHVLENVAEDYRGYVEEHLGLVESVISRMVPVVPEEIRRKNFLSLMAEEYAILPVDRRGFKGEVAFLKGMVAYDNLKAYEERKLFTHNCGHAISAYLGYQYGYRYIYEAISDKGIREKVTGALWESGQALIKKHGFKVEEQEAHIHDLLRRFGNTALRDTVARVAKDPLRKLGPQDRLIGAAKLALEYGIKPEYLSLGIAAALRYDNPEDEKAVKLSRDIREKGIARVLESVCGLDKGGELARMIVEKFRKIE